MIFCIFGAANAVPDGVCRGACPLPYWGIFSDTEYCGSENSLISYGIFSVNTLRRTVRLPFCGGYPCRLLTHITPPLFFPFRSVGGGAVGYKVFPINTLAAKREEDLSGNGAAA